MNLYGSGLLQGIDTIIIRVRDYEISRNWYVEKLELSILWDEPAMRLAVLDTKSAVSLTIWQTPEKIEAPEQSVSYPIFRTVDAAALRNELIKRKVRTGEIIRDEHVTYFMFYDPDGNLLEACQVHE